MSVAGALLAAGSVFAPSVFALEAGVRGMYRGSKISGDIRTVTNGVHGTDLDVKSGLALNDENVFNGEVFLKAGRFTRESGRVLRDGENGPGKIFVERAMQEGTIGIFRGA